MTILIFVRHAEPEHNDPDDRNRPLTAQGMKDTAFVLETLKNRKMDAVYCSPYRRSRQTIESTADYFGMEPILDERLREREGGSTEGIDHPLQKRWADFSFHEPGGESIGMVQKRNIEAIHEILQKEKGKTVVIGTHGTALSSILNYYDPAFDCDGFLRIMEWMPYILEIQFMDDKPQKYQELGHMERPF